MVVCTAGVPLRYPSASVPPVTMMPKASHPKGSDILDQWAHPCELSGELLAQRTLRYDAERFEFVRAASALFGLDDGEPMGDLHLSPIRATLEDTPPALRRAQVKQLGPKVTKEERKDARNHAVRWDKREECRIHGVAGVHP